MGDVIPFPGRDSRFLPIEAMTDAELLAHERHTRWRSERVFQRHMDLEEHLGRIGLELLKRGLCPDEYET